MNKDVERPELNKQLETYTAPTPDDPQASPQELAQEDPVSKHYGEILAISHPRVRAHAMVDAARGYAEAGRFDEALTTAETIDHTDEVMPRRDYNAMAYIRIAEQMFKAGKTDEALEAADKALENINAIQDKPTRIRGFRRLVITYQEMGDDAKAEELVDTAKDVAQEIEYPDMRTQMLAWLDQPFPWTKVEEYNAEFIENSNHLVANLPGCEPLDERSSFAKDILAWLKIEISKRVDMQGNWQEAGKQAEIVNGYLERGELDRAFLESNLIGVPFVKGTMQAKIAENYMIAGEAEKAKSVARAIEHEEFRSIAQKNISITEFRQSLGLSKTPDVVLV